MEKISKSQKTKLNKLCLIFDVNLKTNPCWMDSCWIILNKISCIATIKITKFILDADKKRTTIEFVFFKKYKRETSISKHYYTLFALEGLT
jgi:hypothetical protein